MGDLEAREPADVEDNEDGGPSTSRTNTAAPTKIMKLSVSHKSRVNTDDMLNEAYNTMKQLHRRTHEVDEHQVFGDFIAWKVGGLNTKYAQSAVQHKIHNIIYEAEQGLYDNPPERHTQNMHSHTTSLTSGHDVSDVIVHALEDNEGVLHFTDM